MQPKLIQKEGSICLVNNESCAGAVEYVKIDCDNLLHIYMPAPPRVRNFEKNDRVRYCSKVTINHNSEHSLTVVGVDGSSHYICKQDELKYLYQDMKELPYDI